MGQFVLSAVFAQLVGAPARGQQQNRFRLSSPLGRWFAVVVGVLPFGLTLLALVGWSENIVFHDDYALLRFLLDWTDPAVAWGRKLQLLVEPHNHHRIVYDRLVTLGTYYLTGQMNILLMIALGNLALLGIVWRLWTLFRRTELPGWYFIPVPYWLLNPQSHENMFWGMAALQNFTVIWLMFETLHRLIRRDSVWGPLLLSVAALFTSGNGLLAVAVGSVLVGWQWRWRSDGWQWVAGVALALGLFFWNFERVPMPGTLLEAGPKLLMVLGASLTNQVRFGVAAAGGALIAMGGLVALTVCLLSRRPRLVALRRTDAFAEVLAFGAIVLGTAVILSLSRPPDELLRDRYRIYSHLSFSLLYITGLLLLSNRLRGAWGLTGSMLAIAMYVVSAYAKIPEILNGRQLRQLDAYNVSHNNTTLPPPYYAESNRAMLARSYQRGVFTYPVIWRDPVWRDPVWRDPARWKQLDGPCRITVEPFSNPNPTVFFARNNHYLRVRSSPAFGPGHTQLGGSACLLAESVSGRRYALPATCVPDSKVNLLRYGRYLRNERLTEFQKAVLPPGTYRLGLLFTRGTTVDGYVMSSQTFTVAPTD